MENLITYQSALALLLAARIHGTDDAIRATAKRCLKRLPRSKREPLYQVVDSRSPLDLVSFLVRELEL